MRGPPTLAAAPARGFAGVRGGPVAFVAIEIAPDLRRPGAERTDVLGELQYFSSRIQGVAVGGQGGAELRVAGDRGVPNAVDGGEEVADADGVQPAPLVGGEHSGVELQMEMAVRISGAGDVVPHRHS